MNKPALIEINVGRCGRDRLHRYICECGTSFISRANNINTGNTRSCGCLALRIRTVHGHCRSGRSPTYRSWYGMVTRTTNPNSVGWKNYGGRGITVCTRWLIFENFLADMGDRPKGRSIDRIDNNGNYEPLNCRWATSSEQRRNQRVKPRRSNETA